jgi:hypothetical protein
LVLHTTCFKPTEMKNTINYTYLLLKSSLIFPIAFTTTYLFEDYYRIWILRLFKLFSSDHIHFLGVDFHQYPSNFFSISFGIYASLFYFLTATKAYKRIKIGTIATTIFIVFTIIQLFSVGEYVDFEMKDDSQFSKNMKYTDLNYDQYFVVSLIASLIYLVYSYINLSDELKGTWTTNPASKNTNQDINLITLQFGNEKKESINTNTPNHITHDSFQWVRLGDKKLRIKKPDSTQWTTIHYQISEHTSNENQSFFKLTEQGKDSFWYSPEPLFRKKE